MLRYQAIHKSQIFTAFNFNKESSFEKLKQTLTSQIAKATPKIGKGKDNTKPLKKLVNIQYLHMHLLVMCSCVDDSKEIKRAQKKNT